MVDSESNFRSLPREYQHAIRKAQEQHNISITPLQVLVGGRSGAAIYLVSISHQDSGQVEHLIMKLDRKRPKSSEDEITRHHVVLEQSPPDFAQNHLPEIHFERIEDHEVLVIFYGIAGQSLLNFRTLSQHSRQDQLETLFSVTHTYLLDGWNQELIFRLVDHPQDLLASWLGFRLDPGQKIESFLQIDCGIHPTRPGLIINGNIYPNPLLYARQQTPWGEVRPADAMFGFQHGDLNTNNILASFSSAGKKLAGYYLIDFALFKEDAPLLYDQRYLEMSFLIHAASKASPSSIFDLAITLANIDVFQSNQTSFETSGISATVTAGRSAFSTWIDEQYPSLKDDLWGQYWLAGVAAGLNYAHKAALDFNHRLTGLIYAAANLKRYFKLFQLQLPAQATLLPKVSSDESEVQKARNAGITPIEPPNNLPPPPTKFIGRSAELVDLTNSLLKDDVRLLTLTGPGGTGKTRLAIELGRALLAKFQDGVFFIDLSALTDPALLVTTTSHSLGIREGGGRPALHNLKDFLASKKLLLIFDNFEQIAEAATLVSDLLNSNRGIKALVTSRVPLQLRGESEFPVPPLRLPTTAAQTPLELLEFESIALFQQQAQAVKPQFAISQENSEIILEICRRLDGLPLAIELAAARIKMLPPQAILKRLDQSLQLLVSSQRDLPDRQQTLRNAIDWSYNLLAEDEQLLLCRLGVFSGGFTLNAVETICNPGGALDVFSSLESLLNNSLVRRVSSVGDDARFDLLQTIRDYALEKGDELGIIADLRPVHCHYFAQLSGGGGINEGAFGAESVLWLRQCNEEHDNYRAALSWALSQEDAIPLATFILSQLTWFWYRYGHLQEGSEWTERALNATRRMQQTPARALALIARSYLALWVGDSFIAIETAREAIDLSRKIAFEQGLSMAKLSYGTALIHQGKDREAYPHLVEAVELYDQQRLPWMKGTTLVHLANVSLGLGEPERARRWLDMAFPILKETGDPWSMAFGLNNYGEVARAEGDYEKAEEYYLKTGEYFELADARGDQARLVHTFGYIALSKGAYQDARQRFLDSLYQFRELGNHRGVAECLAGLASLSAHLGELDRAVKLLGAADRQLESVGGAWWPADRIEIEQARTVIATGLQELYDPLHKQGESMDFEAAIAFASLKS